MTPVDAEDFIAKVTAWAQGDSRVAAAGVCGSHARGEARPDSDVDLCILTAAPGSLLEERSWVHGFGADARIAKPVEDYGLVQAIRVFYGSLEVEFGITAEAWAQIPIDEGTAGVINDGLWILYDPDGRLAAAKVFAAKMLG